MSLTTRFIIIVIVVLGAAFSAYPPGEKINLGLDLRGGIHLVLQVQTDDAVRAETDQDIDRLTEELEDDGLSGLTVERTADNRFTLRGVTGDNIDAIEDVAEEFLGGWNLDRQGDVANFRMDGAYARQIEDMAVRQALETVRNRVDAFGVAEPLIVREGLTGDRIVVQLPGVDDPERVKRLIKNTAFLEFRLAVDDVGPAGSREELLDYYGGTVPSEVELMAEDLKDPATDDIVGQQYWALETKRVITGRDLRTARPSTGQFGEPVVNFTLNREGGETFGEVTSANINRRLAIVLDGKVVSAPSINGRITTSGVITGSFSQDEVRDLAMVLRSGALPAGITYLEDRTVGPSLGQDSIERGRRAGLIGGVLVMITLLIVYRLTGSNAVLALLLNVVLVFGALSLFGGTLTLPGIAGIVLTIGMAVDANVLVFERIREELRNGRTVKSAIDTGFAKALSSVFDANITTLIAAIFLFTFGTGPIRGFAVTLSIGIVASLFTAVFLSRWIFDFFIGRRQRVDSLSI
ncbi:MAG: protein translocase subunit SecD [Acidobacteriota bacterium]